MKVRFSAGLKPQLLTGAVQYWTRYRNYLVVTPCNQTHAPSSNFPGSILCFCMMLPQETQACQNILLIQATQCPFPATMEQSDLFPALYQSQTKTFPASLRTMPIPPPILQKLNAAKLTPSTARHPFYPLRHSQSHGPSTSPSSPSPHPVSHPASSSPPHAHSPLSRTSSHPKTSPSSPRA